MKSLKKVICAGLFLILSSVACFSQNSAETDSLSFRRGSFSNQYYIGSEEVSYDDFMRKLGDKGEQPVKMFKTGKSQSIAGGVVGGVGAYCVGYYLGGRLAGSEGNIALLAGGGGILIGGIILSYLGDNKMKKALMLYKSDSAASLSISPAQTGIGLCINF